MTRNAEKEATCVFPRYLAEDIYALIEADRTPARTINEYVRHAVARQVEEDNHKPSRTHGSGAAAVGSSFVAGSASDDARESHEIARGNRRSVPGFNLDAVGAEDASGI